MIFGTSNAISMDAVSKELGQHENINAVVIAGELQTEGFKDIIPHIFLSANYYDCWLDQLLRTK